MSAVSEDIPSDSGPGDGATWPFKAQDVNTWVVLAWMLGGIVADPRSKGLDREECEVSSPPGYIPLCSTCAGPWLAKLPASKHAF